jgi:hypothetical protein
MRERDQRKLATISFIIYHLSFIEQLASSEKPQPHSHISKLLHPFQFDLAGIQPSNHSLLVCVIVLHICEDTKETPPYFLRLQKAQLVAKLEAMASGTTTTVQSPSSPAPIMLARVSQSGKPLFPAAMARVVHSSIMKALCGDPLITCSGKNKTKSADISEISDVPRILASQLVELLIPGGIGDIQWSVIKTTHHFGPPQSSGDVRCFHEVGHYTM